MPKLFNYDISILFCLLMCTCTFVRNDIRNIVWYFIHIDIGYDCIVSSCIVELNILILHFYLIFMCPT